MGRRSVLCAFVIAVASGCATKAPPHVAGCPVPVHAGTAVPIPDTIPVLRSEGIQCVIWQDNEGDGHVVRIIQRIGGRTQHVLGRMTEDGYKFLQDKVRQFRQEEPSFRDRHLWTICSVDDGVTL